VAEKCFQTGLVGGRANFEGLEAKVRTRINFFQTYYEDGVINLEEEDV
jgi:hypothetical protein